MTNKTEIKTVKEALKIIKDLQKICKRQRGEIENLQLANKHSEHPLNILNNIFK